MNITDVKVRKPEISNDRLLAYADIIIDNAIAVHGIKIVNNGSKTFVSFPNTKKVDADNIVKYKDIIHPINSDTRSIIEKAILDEYNKIA